MSNNKAQLGETMTWVVATLVIIGVLLIFIYVSSALFTLKKIPLPDFKAEFSSKVDFISSKTSFAYLGRGVSEENKTLINSWIKEEKNG